MGLVLPNGLQGLPDMLNKPEAEKVQAWICQGQRCLAPVTGPLELTQALQILSQKPN